MKNFTKKFEKALSLAEDGDIKSQIYIAEAYEEGKIIETDNLKAFYWYKKAAEQGDEYAEYSIAYCYQHGIGIKKNSKLAYKLYKVSSHKGYFLSQLFLGYCYKYGIGVSTDYELANKWFKLSAIQGSASAQLELGRIYIYKENKKATKWLKLSAEQGNVEAQWLLGDLYEYSNPKLYFYWHNKAADQGHNIAQYDVGLCYFKGYGTTQNLEKAFKYFKKYRDLSPKYAAAAKCYLAHCYEFGYGVKKNLKKAVLLYQQLIEDENNNLIEDKLISSLTEIYMNKGPYYNPVMAFKLLKKGCQGKYSWFYHNLAYCYFNGFGVKKNRPLGIKWFELSAKENDLESMYTLGEIYQNETKYKNVSFALKWFKKASKHGHAYASFFTGVLYQIDLKNKEAIKWFKIGAKQGDKYCQSYLAECYFFGKGVKQNIPLGIKLLKKAEKQNHMTAITLLGRFYENTEQKYKSYKQAIYYYKKAAKYKDLEGIIRLAFIFYEGKHIQKNYKKTFQLINTLFKETKNNNHWGVPSALLSMCYYEGIGIKRSVEKSKKYIQKSIKQGFDLNDYELDNPYKDNFNFFCKRVIENDFTRPIHNYIKQDNNYILIGQTVQTKSQNELYISKS